LASDHGTLATFSKSYAIFGDDVIIVLDVNCTLRLTISLKFKR